MQKNDIRKHYIHIRSQTPKHKLEEISQAICIKLQTLIKENHWESVGIYYPIRNEINLLHLIDWASNQGIKILTPVTKPNWAMEFYEVKDIEDFTHEGMYKIPEPNTDKLSASVPDCLIVPGLTFDRYGWRVGYGQGYYDSYLKNNNCKTVGAVYSGCLSETKLPYDEWDQPMNYVLTEKELICLN